MKKLLFCSLCVSAIGLLSASAQPTDVDIGSKLPARQFKVYNNPTTDKNDQFEIQSLGGTTFLASNTVDGTANSYKHTLQINMSLIPIKTTSVPAGANFQLVFYSELQPVQQAATYTDGVLNIYYPISFYDGVREKLEQALLAKRKVYVKVVQKPNGYREGTLIF
jgi:hypothetical protein